MYFSKSSICTCEYSRAKVRKAERRRRRRRRSVWPNSIRQKSSSPQGKSKINPKKLIQSSQTKAEMRGHRGQLSGCFDQNMLGEIFKFSKKNPRFRNGLSQKIRFRIDFFQEKILFRKDFSQKFLFWKKYPKKFGFRKKFQKLFRMRKVHVNLFRMRKKNGGRENWTCRYGDIFKFQINSPNPLKNTSRAV